MLQNYLKIALRNLLKFKGYAVINIFGLAIGIACCMLIVQHLRDELKHDTHHADLDRLYRVNSSFKTGDRETNTATSPSPLAWTLVQDYPEVEEAVRLLKAPNISQYLVKYEDRSYFETKGYLADSTFFRLFTFDFIEGDPSNSLDEPFNVVISKQLAQKLFGEKPALHKSVKISDQWGEEEYKITGVFDPKAYPSHLDGNFYMNMRSGPVGRFFHSLNEWAGNNLFYTYIRLSPEASAASLAAKFPALVEEKAGERLRTLGFEKAHHLEAVRDIYLKSDVKYQIGPTGNMSFVYIFAAIAAFILLIACINFMNLSTAKATIRAQEVGVRKVIGASRGMLSGQFLTEAFIYTTLAVAVAYVIAELALPVFNRLTEKTLDLNFTNDSVLFAWMAGILVVTSLVAGSYPALYLASFSPVKIFRGKTGDKLSARQVRKLLVVVQFIVSIALIQGILVIQQQMEYMRQKELGFDMEAKLVVPLNTTSAAEKYSIIKESFLENPAVSAVGGANTVPGIPSVDDMLVYGEGQNQETSFHTMVNWCDPHYLPLMKFELITGRFFDETRLADTVVSAVINEKLMHHFGYPQDQVIGKKFFWNWDGNLHTHEIIGVVKNFHSGSLRQEVDNQVFFWNSNRSPQQLVASVATHDLPGLISDLNTRWTTTNPGEPFDYFFIDEKLQQAYQNDRKVAGLVFAFTLLAIFISCLGLFGLAAFAAESRTKEIGVRKVLGATTGSIVSLLSKDFLLLVVVALVVATPVAWYFMNGWLQDFHYHVDMPWWSFGLAGAVALLIAFLTVGFQSVRAATANPVNSLRSE